MERLARPEARRARDTQYSLPVRDRPGGGGRQFAGPLRPAPPDQAGRAVLVAPVPDRVYSHAPLERLRAEAGTRCQRLPGPPRPRSVPVPLAEDRAPGR